MAAHQDLPGSPVVGTLSSSAEGVGSIPGRGVKIPHASQPKSQNIKQKQYHGKFYKDFKKWSTFFKKYEIKEGNVAAGRRPGQSYRM